MLREKCRVLSVFGVLVAAVSVAAGQPPVPAGAKQAVPPGKSMPRIQLSHKEWNFGQVWHGQPCEFQLELKNVGGALLHITGVRSSCGCTVAQPDKWLLQPGEVAHIKVTYDSTKTKKQVEETITIETDDPIEPQVKFKVYGEVWHIFDAKPYPAVGFGFLKADSEKTESIELHSNLKQKVSPKIGSVVPPGPFDVKLEEVKPGRVYKLVARTKPPLPIGNTRSKVEIQTGVKWLPTMSVSINVRVFDRVAVQPDNLRVVPVHKTPGTRSIRLYYDQEQPLKIKEIKTSHPSVTARQVPPRPWGEPDKMEYAVHEIRANVPPFAEFPEGGVEVEIYTDHPDPKFQKFSVLIDKVHDPYRTKKPPSDSTPPPPPPTGIGD